MFAAKLTSTIFSLCNFNMNYPVSEIMKGKHFCSKLHFIGGISGGICVYLCVCLNVFTAKHLKEEA